MSEHGKGDSVRLPDPLLRLLRAASPCFVATLMPDGSPHLTQNWVTTDGEHIIVNAATVQQKTKNLLRDPRIALNIVDPEESSHYYAVRGRVIAVTAEGAWDSINELSRKYLGTDFPESIDDAPPRVLLTIEAHSITSGRPAGMIVAGDVGGARSRIRWSWISRWFQLRKGTAAW